MLHPSILSSELDSLKSRSAQDLSNLRTLNVIITGQISHQSVKNLKHFGAVTSNAKHSDCGFFGHNERGKSVGDLSVFEAHLILYLRIANVTELTPANRSRVLHHKVLQSHR